MTNIGTPWVSVGRSRNVEWKAKAKRGLEFTFCVCFLQQCSSSFIFVVLCFRAFDLYSMYREKCLPGARGGPGGERGEGMCEDQVGQPTSTNDKGEVSVARLARLALITDWYRNLCPARGFGRSLAGDSSGKVERGAPAPPSSPYLPYFFFFLPPPLVPSPPPTPFPSPPRSPRPSLQPAILRDKLPVFIKGRFGLGSSYWRYWPELRDSWGAVQRGCCGRVVEMILCSGRSNWRRREFII